ncbi:type 1 glutamine amidotransferase [Halobacillus shinanisalinarum]|uniref:Type 1 glutamine amidotransferase n=9 Tax=Bacillaceae TaxID=186817 RepID=A0A549YHV7_9BACI|nr:MULTISPECIES: type 1 glutamine amidotransferase domain-containing protein [Bacillaceae]ALX48781.1 general stress protein [Lentibacillus amyloliquefaciens]QKY69377.1 type 1 glutamine amidotransferase [Lentibacillus sp. CBA3610]TFJ91374.1 type 1 glutamine amidotransferase [Lentibacillus salicampi]TFJ91458.1 type 1 glutamine amidotransferase [Lentibacillus salicampi]TMN20833.1 type 1 glutamine amidotransferase [Lentibacillus cibarius]
MSRHIAVLVTDMVEEIELTDPVKAYKEAGHTVDIISNEAKKTINGKNGDEIQADRGIDEVNANDYDALLVPGGFSPDLLRINPKNSEFAKTFFQDNKPIFSICHGPQFLVNTDQLKGRELTSFVSVRKDLENAGATVKDEEVIVDGNLVTSRTPDDLPAFNRESLKLLEK